ncbi:MAG TPA: TolC family protein [Vicinamibacterales bacterium]|nr:TolC family protein [Vicinamibacterales bacterium]
MSRYAVRLALLMLTAAGGGCATLGPDRGRIETDRLVGSRSNPALEWAASPTPDADSARLREQPMTPVNAVQMALLRSPRLQQEYARLGLIRADVQEALQIANPRLNARRLTGGGLTTTTLGLAMPLADLLVLPTRARLAKADYERAKSEIAASILVVTADVEAGWYEYVGGQQIADMRATVASGMATAADLAQRFFDAGNITELQLRQEQAAATQARIDAARARADAQRSRLHLNTLIGLSGADAQWPVSAQLPSPVAEEDSADALEAVSRGTNLQLVAARQELLVMEGALDATRRFRLLGGTEIGYEREKEADGARLKGPTLNLELPIFNQGQARVARAQALVAQSRARLAELELAAGNAVRLGAERVRVLRDIVETHRNVLIPQRESVVARSQEQQNYMIIGVFELIQAKRQEYDAYQSYLESIRDYWLARTDLLRAVGARLPSESTSSPVKAAGTPGRQSGGTQ